MKTERNILIAMILNLSFSIFEFFGGMLSGSVAIASDAIHDLGDALSIGISYVLEKKSKKRADEEYTFGYGRYSVIGGFITTLILLVSSLAMIASAADRILHPVKIHYQGMIVFALIGVCVNACAACFTGKGESLNLKAVNLHMLEDVLGWIVVLIGAVVMHMTDFALLDPIMSIAVSLFILCHAIKNLKEITSLFLEKTPRHLAVSKIKEQIEAIDGILDVHHVHVWSLDGQNHLATMHAVTDGDPHKTKEHIREKMLSLGVSHVTIELESSAEHCHERNCLSQFTPSTRYHHHHHE